MDRMGRDELFYKIIDKDEENALCMIDNIENVNFQDVNGYSYLHAAAQSELIEIIKKLLCNGAYIDIKDKFGRTPLMIAVSGYKGDISTIEFLIKHGANPEMKANSNVSCMQLAKMKGLNLDADTMHPQATE